MPDEKSILVRLAPGDAAGDAFKTARIAAAQATHTGLRDGTNRDVAIEYGTSTSDMAFVDRMFDEHGSETTDPVAAVEVEIDGDLVKVVAGGVFDIKVRVESNAT